MKTEELIDFLRVCADDDIICPACERYNTMGKWGGTAKCNEDLMIRAAEALERLEAELRDERHRHDRLQDFEVAEAEELRKVKAERDDAARNSYTVQQIEEIQNEAYDLGVESALHHHFGLSWDDVKELREQITAIQERNRWIPVTERLPEVGRLVLVSVDGAVDVNYREGEDKWGFEYDQKVTHWMPLPEPPKEVE